jgi:dimethylamine/trimethylamine dehydrogenase
VSSTAATVTMACDPAHEVLFEPISIGPKVARNRFYQVPHCANFGAAEPETQARFRATKAEGGWGVVHTEYCSIHPESDDRPRTAAQLWDAADVRNAARLCEEVHAHHSLVGVELWYGGPHAPNVDSRLPARGVSQIPSDYDPAHSCYAMSKADIRVLQGYYRDAAVRAREAGFDLINVYGGQAHAIPHQFLDPFYNRRTDEYGGCFENRARFWVETLEIVRDAVGDECAVTARAGYQIGDAGVTLEDACRFVETADHLVDLWDLTISNLVRWSEDVGPSRSHPENFQSAMALAIRPWTKKPIVGVGRFVSPDVMARVLSSGQLDMIGAARPSIADPFLPAKIADGRSDEIRECIGCNVCISRVWGVGSRLVCTQNPTAGEEYRRGWHPERFTRAGNAERDVLIVGAGPAGLECGVVLAKRGMANVHVVDANAEIGGNLRWIAELPGLAQWRRVIDYRKSQFRRLKNLRMLTGSHLTADAVAEYGADCVIAATGSTWVGDGLNNVSHAPIDGADAGLPWQYTPDQIMAAGKPVTGDRIVIYDCDGYFMATSLAERLALAGHGVTLITPSERAAVYTRHTGEWFDIAARLDALSVQIATGWALTSVHPDRVEARDVCLPEHRREWPSAGVVLVTHRTSDTTLWDAINVPDCFGEEPRPALFRIGDCVVPRMLSEAIFDGHRLAREIDTNNPAVAAPYARESRVLEALSS